MLRAIDAPSDALQDLLDSGDSAAALYETMRSWPSERRLTALRGLNASARSRLFRLLGAREAAEILEGVDPDGAAAALADLAADDAADVLGEMSLGRREEVLSRMPPPAGGRARQLLRYGKDTAGGRMGEEFLAFPETMTLGQVTEQLRRASIDRDRATYLYALDEQGRLSGVLPMRDLVLGDPSTPVGQVLRRDIVTVEAHADQEEAARTFRQRNLLGLPVVDEDRRVLGVITPDDVAQVIEEEAAEDLLKLSGIADGEEAPNERVRQAVLRRLPWLILNLFLNIAAVSVVAYFEGTVQAVVALAVLLPMVSTMGGNAGIQTLSSTIRALAVGSVGFGQFGRVFLRESLVGLLNGCAIGVLLAALAYFWKGVPALGLIAGVAIWMNVLIGGVMGAAIPLVLHKLKTDPASSAGPILTTVTDFAGFFITLKMATVLLARLVPEAG